MFPKDGAHQLRHGLLQARPAKGLFQLGDLGCRWQLGADHGGQQRQPLVQLRCVLSHRLGQLGHYGLRLGFGRHAEQVPQQHLGHRVRDGRGVRVAAHHDEALLVGRGQQLGEQP